MRALTRLAFPFTASLFSLPLAAAAQPVSAGPDVVLECESPEGAEHTLNGTAPVGEGIVNEWSTDPVVALENADTLTPTGTFPLGVTTVTLTSTPGASDPVSDDATITVEDTQAPVVRVYPNPRYLWPPNHTLHVIETDVRVRDRCSGAGDEDFGVELIDVRSNESDNGLGDGNTSNDIQGADLGSDDRSVMLRAERAGPGSGRIYTLVYRITDGSGNTTDAEANVHVPHDFADLKDLIGRDDDDEEDMEAICRRPADAVDQLAEMFPGLGSANDEGVCNDICRAWARSCDDIAKGSGRCVAGEEKALAVIAFAECKDSDDRRDIAECREAVKDELAAQKAELRVETDEARDRCANMGRRCANACDDMFDDAAFSLN
ncbi:MAG TPA: hypothetical protein VEC56_11730 [Candidatus Krumholzibacteria bacterium]|nr:hypothetical protein [Candidatus Krumholzibacteria bacterium]